MGWRWWMVGVLWAGSACGGAGEADDGFDGNSEEHCTTVDPAVGTICASCVDNEQTQELRSTFLDVLADDSRDDIRLVGIDHYVDDPELITEQHAVVRFEVAVDWYHAVGVIAVSLPKPWYDLPLDELRAIMVEQIRTVPIVDDVVDADTIRDALHDCDPELEWAGCGGGTDFLVSAGRDWFPGECRQHSSYASVDARTGELIACQPDESHDICEDE